MQLPSWKSVFIPVERWFHVCQDVWCMYVCWLKKKLLLNKWFDNSISKSSVTVRQLVPWWKDLCQIYGLQQHCEQICRGKEILFQLEFSSSLEPKINCLKELLEHEIHDPKSCLYKSEKEKVSKISHTPDLWPKMWPKRCNLYISVHCTPML